MLIWTGNMSYKNLYTFVYTPIFCRTLYCTPCNKQSHRALPEVV